MYMYDVVYMSTSYIYMYDVGYVSVLLTIGQQPARYAVRGEQPGQFAAPQHLRLAHSQKGHQNYR